MAKLIDLTNQRFGKLQVIKNVGKKNNKDYFWECQCDCGKIISVRGASLRSGNTKSCGCGKYDGLKNYNLIQSEKAKLNIGDKFGKLTIVKDLGFKKHVTGHSRRWYLCKCDCGNFKEVMGNNLTQNQTISCGKCLTSKGEYQICQILDKLNIKYDHDTVYPSLKLETGRNLRFDFIIYNKDNSINRIIEFDGRQHYTGPDNLIWSHSRDTLQTIKEKDSIKNTFCKKHNIPLIRIPYWITITEEVLFSNKYLYKGDDDSD